MKGSVRLAIGLAAAVIVGGAWWWASTPDPTRPDVGVRHTGPNRDAITVLRRGAEQAVFDGDGNPFVRRYEPAVDVPPGTDAETAQALAAYVGPHEVRCLLRGAVPAFSDDLLLRIIPIVADDYAPFLTDATHLDGHLEGHFEGSALVIEDAPGFGRIELALDGLLPTEVQWYIGTDYELVCPSVVLVPAATVSGRAVDTAGRPQAGVAVAGCGGVTETDAAGEFWLEAEAGWCQVTGSRSDGTLVTRAIVELDLEPGDEVDIDLVFPAFRRAGLGISIEPTAQGIRIVTVHDDLPAQAAGLLPDDVILEADGVSLADVPSWKATESITGPAGTSVKLIVDRAGQTRTITVDRIEF